MTAADERGTGNNRADYAKFLVGRSYRLFKSGIKAEKTLVFYNRCLYIFCKHVNLTTEELVQKYSPYVVQEGQKRPNIDGIIALQQLIEDYILMLREQVEQGKLKASSCSTRMPPVRLFFEMNDVVLNWTKLGRLLPRSDMAASDEAYTRSQIQAMLPHCDLRARTVVLFLASSGIRLGAFPTLRDGDIRPMYDSKNPSVLLCAHLRVYADTDSEYDTFVTPEAYCSYQEYRNLRIKWGEELTDESPAFVARFDEKTLQDRKPKAMNYHAIQKLLDKIRKKAGVAVQSKQYSNRRYTVKVVHGFRKSFLTALKSVKDADGKILIEFGDRERLMGHALTDTLSLENNYDRQDRVATLMREYLKAVPALTVSDEARLGLELSKLEKDVQSYKSIEVELHAKDKESRDLKNEVAELRSIVLKLKAHIDGDLIPIVAANVDESIEKPSN